MLCSNQLYIPEFTITVIALYQIIQGNENFSHYRYDSKEQTYCTGTVFQNNEPLIIVSILERDEGCAGKYSFSSEGVPKGKADGNSRGQEAIFDFIS